MIEASVLKEKLQRLFGLYEDLIQELKKNILKSDLAGLPSNTIGQQLWCVIGARQLTLTIVRLHTDVFHKLWNYFEKMAKKNKEMKSK